MNNDIQYKNITACPICGCNAFVELGKRADGVAIIKCEKCKMGFTEKHPADLSVYYSNHYYHKTDYGSTGSGYEDYSVDAPHSLDWAAYLTRIIRKSGNALDVGCANGYLLEKIGAEFKRFGIEVSQEMANICREIGIEIIGDDINDWNTLESRTGTFDVIMAIAVLEHVADLRGALQNIKQLLSEEGFVIFEVPLLSVDNDNTKWFSSSLEHVFYPTMEGLQRLFQAVFDLPLIGHEVIIQGYASTYIGLACKDPVVYQTLLELHQKYFLENIRDLKTSTEKTCRFLHDVVHAAQITPEHLLLLPDIDQDVLLPHVRRRIMRFWQHDLYWKQEAQTLHQLLTERQNWINQLEQGKSWLESQVLNWQTEAANVQQLEIGKAWLEQQNLEQALKIDALSIRVDQQQQTVEALERQTFRYWVRRVKSLMASLLQALYVRPRQ